MPRSDYAITVVVLIIVLVVGGMTMGAIGGKIEERNNALENRAQAVYGDEYVIVASDDCYDYCATTATTTEYRRQAILIQADRNHGWVSKFELSQAVEGHSVEYRADQLVEEGLLERRKSAAVGYEYRYIGPEGAYEDGLSDSELQQLIRNQLYVSGAWMSFDEIHDSVPAVEWRVRKALAELEEKGEIQTGTESESAFIPMGHTAYAHESVDHPPAGSNNMGTLFLVTLVVAAVAFVIGRVRLYRHKRGLQSEG